MVFKFKKDDRRSEDEDEDIFNPEDIPDIKQSTGNVDFANLLLDKHDFIQTLSPDVRLTSAIPPDIRTYGTIMEKNIALANLNDAEAIQAKHKMDDLKNTLLMQMPPRYHNWVLEYQLSSVQFISDLEITRAKGGAERRLLATQLSESTVNSNIKRDGDQPATTWLGRIAKSFRR